MYDAIFKIVIFGDAGSGKTTLTKRLMTNLFISDTQMTIGVEFVIKTIYIDGKEIKLQIWDFGGEERFRFLLPKYIRGASGGILMYDITDNTSLLHVEDWLSVIHETGEVFPIILIGGKSDLEAYRQISSEEGLEVAKSNDLNEFFECSSKTGENVEKVFEILARLMSKKLI
ncbi:MAG: Rab family GTPase [Promethearchaeota archaeon]|jgi:small GTP-binding protein